MSLLIFVWAFMRTETYPASNSFDNELSFLNPFSAYVRPLCCFSNAPPPPPSSGFFLHERPNSHKACIAFLKP